MYSTGSSLTISTKEQQKREEVEFQPNLLVFYIDKSRMEDGQPSGAGMYLQGQGVQECFALGKHLTVFQAKVRYQIQMWQEIWIKIFISAPALKAVCSTRTRIAIIQEYADVLKVLGGAKEVNFIWVFGSVGYMATKRRTNSPDKEPKITV